MIELKPHNAKVVEEIMNKYNNGASSVIYTSGVGTGKSYVFMGTAERVCPENGRILYVMPKYTIQSNIEEYKAFQEFQFRVDFVTFNFFTSAEKGIEKISKYQMLVIDECHHLGSDCYGKNLLACMRKAKCPVLGLTATPERDHGKSTPREEYDVRAYFDQVVEGVSTFDAIRMGLMPPFEYRIMMPDQNVRQLEKEYERQYNVRVDYTDCENTLHDIEQTYAKRKWICFFASIRSLHETKPMIARVFSGYTICTLYADLRNLNEIMRAVQTSSRVVILSVNMLLEGVHLPDITGIILFRHVTSLVTFQQMIGRVCSMDNTESPLIADCSQSGPLLLRKLLNENHHAAVQTIAASDTQRPIMSIGIGAERPWEGIEEFLRLTANSLEKAKENRKEAAKKYLSFQGRIYQTADEYRKNKNDWMKLTACARLYHTGPELLIKTLRENAI